MFHLLWQDLKREFFKPQNGAGGVQDPLADDDSDRDLQSARQKSIAKFLALLSAVAQYGINAFSRLKHIQKNYFQAYSVFESFEDSAA